MADRMSALDAFFFYTEEDGRNHMHVGGFALVAGRAPAATDVAAMLRPKIGQIPRYRQMARPVPLHLGRPLWVDAPDFQLDEHVRSVHLAIPGREGLRGELETFISTPLDRSRPLWELLVIDGVGPDEWVIAWKIHHSMVDGVSGTELLTILFDTEPEPEPRAQADPWRPGPGVGAVRALAGSAGGFVGGLGRTVVGVRPRTVTKVVRVSRAGLSLTRHTIVPDLRSPLIGRIGPERSYEWCVVPFEDVRSIRTTLGGTVNDIVLTVVAEGFRALLERRGARLAGTSIRVMNPVALRDRDAEGRPVGDGTMTTKASALMPELPLGVADPVERLQLISEQMATLKQTSQAEAVTAVNEIAALLPGTVTAVVMRVMSAVPPRSLHSTVTNVHGPTVPLYVLGRRIRTIGNYAPPFPVGARTSVTVYSYEGQLVFGVTGDRASLPDVDVITRGITDGMETLLRAPSPA